jgi:hypothetical protein
MSDILPPPFHDLGAARFQEFCAELLGKEERFENSEVYGRNGQSQRGIDVLAQLKSQQGIEVGQCKCWAKVTATRIKNTTDEFLPHLDHWKSLRASRFFLFVACATDDTKVQDQIHVERERFRKVGIGYEVWDARILHKKLRPHADVVRAYSGEHWVETICGSQHARHGLGSPDAGLTAGTETAIRQWGLAISDLTETRNKQLDTARELAAEGHTETALHEIEALCAKPSWSQMPAEVQGKGLRILAGLVLGVREDNSAARALLTEAKRIHPEGSTVVLDTLLLYREQGPQAAVNILAAPKTIDEWNLRQRFLLELGRPVEVLCNYSALPGGLQPNAESGWAKTMALLLNRQVGEARTEVTRALSLKPRNFDLRLADAMVRYMGSVSPVFESWGHLTWPVPPSWNLIKRDTATRHELRQAAQMFRDLATLVRGKALHEVQTWELACLGNDPERQEEAERMVADLLGQWPDFVPAVVWAKERGYEFNKAPVILALRKRLEKRDVQIDEVLACFSILADSGDLEGAESVLDSNRDAFSKRAADHLWALHKAQTLAARGESEEVKKLVEAERDDARRRAIQSAALRTTCRMSKNLIPLAHHLEDSYLRTRDPNLLLDCCFAKCHGGDWRFVADHARELVHAIPTEAVLRLCAQGAFNTDNPELCLELLEGNKHLCLDGRLPTDLRHLAAECHRRSGHLPQAITEAERLVQEGAGIPALAQLFRLQREKGDLKALVLTARKFLGTQGIPPQLLLEAIPSIMHQDPELAQELWRQMRQSAEKDAGMAAAAAMQSFNLGIENEATELLRRMQALAQQPGSPIKALTLEDAVQFFGRADQEIRNLLAQYEKGEIPVHLVVAHSRLALARLFHENPTANCAAPNLLFAPPVLIRYAGRAAVPLPAPPQIPKTVFIDVTSLLLARSLGLLETVEQHFQTIFISAHLTESLLQQLDLLSPHQPALLKANRSVLALVRDGVLKTDDYGDIEVAHGELEKTMGINWCARAQRAKAVGGRVVEHFPLLSKTPPFRVVALPDNFKGIVVSESTLIRAMAASGLLSEAERDAALKTWASNTESFGSPAPGAPGDGASSKPTDTPATAQLLFLAREMPLFLEQSMAGQLAASGILERLSKFCRVVIDREETEALEAYCSQSDRDAELKKWVEDILSHVSGAIDTGKYRTHLHPAPRLAQERAEPLAPEELCLCDAIHFGQTAEALIWCDDRSIRFHERAEKSLLADTFDLLRGLRAQGWINDESYFELLLKLRAANARYIPITVEEILHHVRRARVEAGVLQETPALRLLRQHGMACLLDKGRLQEPVPQSDGSLLMREMVFPVAHYQATFEALAHLWSDSNEPQGDIAARADWLWHNLCVDMRLIPQCFGNPPAEPKWEPLLAASITHLLLLGWGISSRLSDKTNDVSPRRAFSDWVESRLLLPLLNNNGQMQLALAAQFEALFGHDEKLLQDIEKKHGAKSKEALALKVSTAVFVADLPPTIQSAVALTRTNLSRWGLHRGGPAVAMMGLEFSAADFWAAASRALKNGHATLRAMRGPGKIQLLKGPSDTTLRVIKKGDKQKESGVISPDILPLVNSDLSVRIRLLDAHPEWFDLDPEQRAVAIQRIAREDPAEQRVALLGQYRAESMCWFYDALEKRLAEQGSLDILGLLPESLAPLRRHLRLERDQDLNLADCWTTAVGRLLKEEGLYETIIRLSCLPSRLPETVYAALRGMPSVARADLLRKLDRRLISPVQLFHLLALYVSFEADMPDFAPTASQRIGLLCDPEHGAAYSEAFLAILKWVSLRLGWRRETHGWPAHLKLRVTWLHATRLHQAFCIYRADPKFTCDWFTGNSQEFSRDSFSPRSGIPGDAACPGSVFFLGFVLRGLAYGIANAAEGAESLLAARASVSKLVSKLATNFRMAYPLLRRLELGGNCLESFLGQDASESLSRLLGAESYRRLFCTPEDAFQTAVNKLDPDPQSVDAWSRLDALLGSAPVPETVAPLLEQAVRRLNLAATFASDRNRSILLALLGSKYAGKVGTADTKKLFFDQLLALALAANKAQNNSKLRIEDDESLLRLAAIFPTSICELYAQPDTGRAILTVCEQAVRLLAAWPGVASVGGTLLEHLVRQLPIDHQQAYWPLALTLRALR